MVTQSLQGVQMNMQTWCHSYPDKTCDDYTPRIHEWRPTSELRATIAWLQEGKRLIELGAGQGLCGLLAHRLKADEVLLTDSVPDVVDILQESASLAQQITSVPGVPACAPPGWLRMWNDVYYKFI